MLAEKQVFENKDLVLQASPNVDPARFDLNRYEGFLDVLCGDREYQKDAIRVALRYLLGGQYANLRELAEENYHKNPSLQDKYAAVEDFVRHLQLPDRLACSIDLATATGKSYVIYGIARIMLAEGAVDQVLVLCPSTTIEQGLTIKFRALSADKTLKDLLPTDSVVRNPRIIDASTSIRPGDICVENIHATYAHTKSAIEDSLAGKGARTLVVNDEAHHLTSPTDKALKKWKVFLLDPRFGFQKIVSLSGTCYIGNEYFTDVICRYSLRQAMEDRFVKLVRYVAEDSSGSENEKLQKIYANHSENKTKRYRKVGPLTILVTKDIAACKRLTDNLISFLAKKEKQPKANAAKRVLIVTSAAEHKGNVAKLSKVDSADASIEWITSVSMLTEGWDVKNIFQIVPHEERAFNSKLLVAQVLGRGLRVPEVYRGEQPTVTVFNHDKWSKSIRHLVDEVLEIERRVYTYPATKPEDYNFKLHNIEYKRIEEPVEYPQANSYGLLKKGYISFASQPAVVEKTTVYAQALTGKREAKRTDIVTQMSSVDEVAQEIVNRLRAIDMDLDTKYAKEFPKAKVKAILEASLKRIQAENSLISEENRQRALQAFGVVYRKRAKSIRLKVEVGKVFELQTKDLRKSYMGVGTLRRGGSVFWDDNSIRHSEPDDAKLVRELDADENLPKSATVKIENKYHFKTPLNVVLASHEPERRFVRGLTEERNANALGAWIKSADIGFYSIEYSWRKGEHPKQGRFNPDYFLKKGTDVLVIEIKMDDDVNDENRAKLRYAREHFKRLNDLQKRVHYDFKMLSPSSYDAFFQALREGKHRVFRSGLEAALES